MERIDAKGTQELSFGVFMKEINMKTHAEKNKNEIWTISKTTFLIAMIKVYKLNQRRLIAHFNRKFSNFQKQALDKEEFEQLMLEYENSLSVYDVEKLFNEAMSIDPSSTGVSFKAATSIMCKYGFSYLKSFKIKELIENLTPIKAIVALFSSPAQNVKRRTPPILEESKRGRDMSVAAEMIDSQTCRQGKQSIPRRKSKPVAPRISEAENQAKWPRNNLGLLRIPDELGKSLSMIGKIPQKK